MDKIKWYSINEYVDIDTGEKISKSLVEREYIIIKKIKKTIVNNGQGNIIRTCECIKNKQLKLW